MFLHFCPKHTSIVQGLHVPLNEDNHILIRRMEWVMAQSHSRGPIHSYTHIDFYVSFPNGPPTSMSRSARLPRLNHSRNTACWYVNPCITQNWRRRSHSQAKEDSGHEFCEWTRDNHELGMSPRQQASSSIIHLGNKLINEVNEEERWQWKSCRWTKRDI